MTTCLTILHLSDLQFGRNHRYPDGERSFDSLYAKLAEDLDHLAAERGLHPSVIAITGDVAEWSLPAEYAAAQGFLEKLTAKLAVPRQRVVIVPGNHDVNRKLCAGARLMAEGSGEPFEEPFFAKFGNYQRFFNRFFEDAGLLFAEEHLFHVVVLPEQKTLITALNSCIRESERDEDHYGWIGVDQARAAVQRCEQIDPDGSWLRIAALHHNFLGASNLDHENLRDRDAILPWLQKGRFALVLHGHRHIAGVEQFGRHPGPLLHILAAGSTGLDAKTLPDHPNQYQIVQIDNHREVTVVMRQYSARTFGLTGEGRWLPDPHVDPSGAVQFALTAPERAAERRPKATGMPEARKRFLAYLSEDHRYLQMRGFGADLRVPLELEPIYIALRAVPSHAEMARCGPDDDTETPRIEELEIGPALDFAHQHGYTGLIVLGEPGSGKTTLLKFITLCLAQQTPAAKSGIAPNRFPLYLPLRAVTDFKVSLEDALRTVYHEIQSKLPGDFFARVLADEQTRCLIMLDGLDEVATAERRTEALEWIERQRKLYPGQQLLVTSRFAGYRGATRLPENYLELHIREFRDEDVRTFVRRWYRQVETRQRGDTDQWRGWARGQGDDLIQQLFSAENLLGLARNPLLLQLLCLLHRTHGAMPQRRAELYEECIKVLLQKWDEAKGLEVFLSATEARQVLRPLALWLHQEEGRTYADEEDVRRVLRPHLARVKRETQGQAEEQLERVLTSVRDRSGLFVGFDVARYGFQHLSFQEFLAAEEIVKLGESSRLVETFGRPCWREPTLLALGMDDPRFQTALFAELVPSAQCDQHFDLALTCVREALAPCVTPFIDLLRDRAAPWQARYRCAMFLLEIGGAEAITALEAALDDPQPQVAAAVRDALTRLGRVLPAVAKAAEADIRVNAKDGTQLIRIPAGQFWMGSDDGAENERPRHRVVLDEFYIARHPVTNAQYAQFMKETGHKEPYYWDDKRFNQPNQPVVGVTWRDAMEYCQWAGLRLPTERQWEKAARGTDGRTWPWGNEPPDERRCNFSGNVGATTEVGSYPDGASPYGCQDMAGNVWEWCVSKWRDSYKGEPDDSIEGDALRVLRGGCWWDDANAVRCAFRGRSGPRDWLDLRGFRCVQ